MLFLKTKNYKLRTSNGQLLLEALVTIAIASIVLPLGAGLILVSLRGNTASIEKNIAIGLLDQTIEAVRSAAFENWLNVYQPPDGTGSVTASKGSGQLFYPVKLVDLGNHSAWLKHTPPDDSTRWGTDITKVVRGISSLSSREVWVVGGNTSNGFVWRDRGTTEFNSSRVINESRDQWRNMAAAPWNNGNQPASNVQLNDVSTYYNGSHQSAIVVGNGGKVHRWDGDDGWRIADAGGWGAVDINSVSASDATNVWIAGNGDKVYSCDCSTASGTWTSRTTGSGANMLGISAYSSTEVWAVGASGAIRRWTGSAWESKAITGVTAQLNSVSVLASDDVWVAGASGNVWHYNGTIWCDRNLDTTGASPVCPSSGTSWAAATGAWGTGVAINRISAYSGNTVYIVGSGGQAWEYNGETWAKICGEGNWNSTTKACDDADSITGGVQPARWGTTALYALSDRYSPQIIAGGDTGNVWAYSPARWQIGSCGGATCGTSDDFTQNSITYNSNFYIQNVCRDNAQATAVLDVTATDGTTTTCTSPYVYDPSTQKITASVSWTGGVTLTRSEYITRWKNRACVFTNWSTADGGSSVKEECPTAFYDLATNMNTGAALTINTPLTNSTASLKSIIWDTTGIDGPAYNAVRWNGTLNSGQVRIRIATSNSISGPWAASDYYGASLCASAGWYNLGATGTITDISNCNRDANASFNNKRYIKYEIQLCKLASCGTDGTTITTPSVTDLTFFYTP